MADAGAFRKGVLRFLLKILWSVGGVGDDRDGHPRVRGADFQPVLQQMRAADVVLLGNNGLLSHIGVYAGDGKLIHSMATDHTMRGWLGSLRDMVMRLLGAPDQLTGVIEEELTGFLDRFERDAWVVLRHPDMSAEATERGLARVRDLVGRPYDYDFSAGDDEYYCTEVVDELLQAALGDDAPTFETTHQTVPMLLRADVLEPVAVLRHPAMTVVAANDAARAEYPELESA
ncbi:MAG: hypothetical protein KTR31_04945 [Myxococcales bacterium]|nr:hypothetical protein [Myxococcales bacterium]